MTFRDAAIGAGLGCGKFGLEVRFVVGAPYTISFLIESGAGGIGFDPFFCMRLKKLILMDVIIPSTPSKCHDHSNDRYIYVKERLL